MGYLCESVEPSEIPTALSNQILSAIINGLRSDLPNEIRLAAVTALNNSLDFTASNFSVDVERDAILKTVCETTQCADVAVREKAFECFAKIADLYYDKLGSYITTIFQLTTTAIKSDAQAVGLQAIEFWVTLCDCEITIAEDKDQGVATTPSLNIVDQAAPALLPFLLEAMTKQAEDIDDEDSFNIAVSAASCVDAISKTIPGKIIELVLPFITANIQSSNWHFKEAAIMAFGSILEGPSEAVLNPIVSQALLVLISCLQDPTVQVRETAAWTLAKVCEWHKRAISSEALQPLITSLMATLDDKHPKVAAQACYAVHNLAEACQDEREASSNVISHFMGPMLQKLFTVANRPDWDEENLRVSAYEAVNMIVHNSALDMRTMVAQVLSEGLTRLEHTFTPQFNPKERVDLQSMLCGLAGECIQKLDTEAVTSQADKTMQLFLQVFSTRGAAAHEDAFMSVGYLADKLELNFNRYVPHLYPALLNGLRNYEEYQVCTVAVGLVGDMSRALGKEIVAYGDDIMQCLIDLLESANVNKIVKPHAISCFADIAMAMEGAFEKYAEPVLRVLHQASSVTIETDDEDIIEYINSLHEAIFESYSGILQVKRGLYFICLKPVC